MDSNHRRHSQQIYSLPHLATLVTTHGAIWVEKIGLLGNIWALLEY
jgi:hypothetical protein